MKFKKEIKQFLYKLLGSGMYYFFKGIFFTIRVSEETHPELAGQLQSQCIFSFWHGKLLLAIKVFSKSPRQTSGLVSQSAIGDILTRYLEKEGVEIVRGSSTRGAVLGVKALVNCAKRGNHLGLAPDGPRGPRLKASQGILYLAYKTGLPIIPLGVAYSNKITITSSWDHFNFPLPFSRAVIYAGKPLVVTNKENFESDLEQLYEAMQTAESKAQEMLDLKQKSKNCEITLSVKNSE